MEDFDDFDDEFGDDSFEDGFDNDFGPEDSLDDDGEIEDAPRDNDCDDDFTMEDAVVLGGTMMGLAYEEGLKEAKRRKLEKKMDDDRNNRDREDGI